MPVTPTTPLRGTTASNAARQSPPSPDELDSLREAVRRMPYRASTHEKLAIALAQRELFAPALDAFEAALRCDPTQVECILGGGEVLIQQGEVLAAADFATRHFIAAFQALQADTPRLLALHSATPALLGKHFPDAEIEQVMQQLAHHLHEEAIQALLAEQPDTCIALLESVEKFNPAHLGTSHTLGDAYLVTDQPHRALMLLDACAQREPSDEAKMANARLSGTKLLLAGYPEYAIVMFRAAWTWANRGHQGPAERADLLTSLGYAELSLGQFDEALRSFDRSIDIYPLGAAYTNRGLTHLAKHEHEAAWDDFEDAFLLYTHANKPIAVYQLSRALMNHDPDHHLPIQWGAESALSLGLLDESRQLFSRLAEVLPDNRMPRIGLQRIRLVEGDFEAAHTSLDTLAREHPDYQPAHLWAARCRMTQALRTPDPGEHVGFLDQTLEHVREALRLNPSDIEAKAIAAEALFFKGHYKRALAGYDEVEKNLPEPHKSGPFGQMIGLKKTMLADWLDEPHQALDSLVNTLSAETAPTWNFYLQRALISLALDRQNAAHPPESETSQA